jgi:reductive dehalogenase
MPIGGLKVLSVLIFIAALVLIVQALIGLSFFISSIREREQRATNFAALQFAVMLSGVLVFFFLLRVGFFATGIGVAVLICGLVAGAAGAFLLLRKSGENPRALEGTRGLIVGEVQRSDEREIVFARNVYLEPGSKEYEEFYEKHPEGEEVEAKRREVGGPLGTMEKIDKPQEVSNRAALMASGFLAMQLGTPDKVKLEPRGPSIELTPEEATERVRGYARNVGAALVGVTALDPRWVYSHRGMVRAPSGDVWGQEIEAGHRYAIVFAQEMSRDMIAPAPHTSSAIESMNRYVNGAVIADQVASYVANLGYSATANHLSHYDGLMVPLAVDAGLGELGRLGYLMTKEFGPRQRLSAVTTDLPLVPDKPVDIGVEDFCRICVKCAVCCPSQSIPHGEQEEVNGSLRWKLDEITCFAFWGKVGTDCNVCMRVCPWSHARTLPHQIIVWMVARNRTARRLFSWMDDVFYGKRPGRKAPPTWVAD